MSVHIAPHHQHCAIATSIKKLAGWFKKLTVTPKPAEIIHTPKFSNLVPIFIKTLTGRTEMIEIDVQEQTIVLKQKIAEKLKVPVSSQRLIFAQKQLEDGTSLEHYGIRKESTLHLALRLVAGVQVSVQTNSGKVIDLGHPPLLPLTNSATPHEYSFEFSKKNRRGSYTKKACSNCRNAHTACDSGRPCKRCLQLGLSNCEDATRKKAQKRTFGEYDETKTYAPMYDFLPLLGMMPSNSDVKKEEIVPIESSSLTNIEIDELFSDLIDTNYETAKHAKMEEEITFSPPVQGVSLDQLDDFVEEKVELFEEDPVDESISYDLMGFQTFVNGFTDQLSNYILSSQIQNPTSYHV